MRDKLSLTALTTINFINVPALRLIRSSRQPQQTDEEATYEGAVSCISTDLYLRVRDETAFVIAHCYNAKSEISQQTGQHAISRDQN